VSELQLYEAVSEEADPETLRAAVAADHITFTASSTVTAFMGLLDEEARQAVTGPDGPRVVSIGPITSDTARAHGLSVPPRPPSTPSRADRRPAATRRGRRR